MPIENYFKPRIVDPYQGDNSLFYKITDQHGNTISDAAKLELVNSIQSGNEGTPVSAMTLNDMIEKVGTLKQVVSPLILDDNWIPCDGRRINADMYPKLAEIMPARSVEPWSVSGFPALMMDISYTRARFTRRNNTFFFVGSTPPESPSNNTYVTLYSSQNDPRHWMATHIDTLTSLTHLSNVEYGNGCYAFITYAGTTARLYYCRTNRIAPSSNFSYTSLPASPASRLSYDPITDIWVYISSSNLYYKITDPVGTYTAVSLGATGVGDYRIGDGICAVYGSVSVPYLKYIDLKNPSTMRDISAQLGINSTKYPVCLGYANGYWIVQMYENSKYTNLYYTDDITSGNWKLNSLNTSLSSALYNIVHDGDYYYFGGLGYLKSKGEPNGQMTLIDGQTTTNVEYSEGYVYNPAPLKKSSGTVATYGFQYAQASGVVPNIVSDNTHQIYIKGR